MSTPTALWVVPVGEIGGVGRHFLDVASQGIPDWDLVFAAPEGPLLVELRALGATVEPVEIAPDVPLLTALTRLRTLMRDVGPNVVHTHLPRADLLATVASFALPVTLVTTEHTITPDRHVYHSGWKATVMERLHALRLRRFAAVIAVSAATKRAMQQRWDAGEDVVVIRNGVDRPRRVASAPGTRFLSLARLSPEKGLDTTLRAFERIRAELPEATLTVAGEGPMAEELQDLSRALGVHDAVTFTGFVPAAEAIVAHDVVLQPSAAENLSYTLLDAAGHGLGVAATRVGGNAEFLPDHCLVAPKDPETLARVAIAQSQHPDRRPRLPDDVPNVAGMTQGIAEVYSKLGRR